MSKQFTRRAEDTSRPRYQETSKTIPLRLVTSEENGLIESDRVQQQLSARERVRNSGKLFLYVQNDVDV